MKKIYFLFMLFFICQFSFAQTDADYDNTVKVVVEGLQNNDAQKVFDLFSDDLKSTLSLEALQEMMTGAVKEYGTPGEFDFMMDDEGLKRFLIQTDKDSFMLDIALSGDIKITQLKIE